MYGIYVFVAAIFFSVYIGHCGTRLLFVTITRMNGRSFYYRYFVVQSVRISDSASSMLLLENGAGLKENLIRRLVFSGIIQNRKFVRESQFSSN